MRITKKLQKQLRREWVKALRSGKYKQTKRVLCRIDSGGKSVGHCCLGVLCDVYGKLVKPLTITAPRGTGYVKFNGNSVTLPGSVRRAIGLSTDEGRYGYSGETLAHLNDSGKRFSTIAKIIESEPEGLFVS